MKLFIYIGLLCSIVLQAQTPIAELSLNAQILFPPFYADENGTAITSIDFDFQEYADVNPNTHVQSVTRSVQVVDASSYPATVAVVPPTNCSIGANSVADGQIRLIFTSKTIKSGGGNVSFEDGVIQTVRLRFRKQGNYGSLTGIVSCANAGQMTHTY